MYDLKQHPIQGTIDNADNIAKFDDAKGNPPLAEYQSYRLSMMQRFSSFQFSPIAQWYFLNGQTNYAIFYALLGISVLMYRLF